MLEHADVQTRALQRESGGEAARPGTDDRNIADVLVLHRGSSSASGGGGRTNRAPRGFDSPPIRAGIRDPRATLDQSPHAAARCAFTNG